MRVVRSARLPGRSCVALQTKIRCRRISSTTQEALTAGCMRSATARAGTRRSLTLTLAPPFLEEFGDVRETASSRTASTALVNSLSNSDVTGSSRFFTCTRIPDRSRSTGWGDSCLTLRCSQADADLSILGDADRIDLDRLGGGQVEHTASCQVEAGPVQPALDGAVGHFPLRQRHLGMGAFVVNGVDLPVVADQADGDPIDVGVDRCIREQLGGPAYPCQCGLIITSRVRSTAYPQHARPRIAHL